jgi:hypothetical protein
MMPCIIALSIDVSYSISTMNVTAGIEYLFIVELKASRIFLAISWAR